MANVLKMAMIESIQQLHAVQWSQRRIAETLGIDRKTVARYLKQVADFANSPTGSECSKGAILPGSPAPPDSDVGFRHLCGFCRRLKRGHSARRLGTRFA